MAAAKSVRGLPWARILLIGRVVIERLTDDISPKGRKRLTILLRKSKGDPRKLTADDRREILAILRQVDTKKLSTALARDLGARRLLRR